MLVVVALAPTAVARAAPAAPELFVAEGDSSSTQSSPAVWMPLNGARLRGAYRYRLGVKLQANTDTLGRAYVIVRSATAPRTPRLGATVTVPGPGTCGSVRGAAGDIVAFGSASYYGDGAYGLTAALAGYAPGPCPTTGSADSSGTFTVDARPALAVVGGPRSHDSRPVGGFRGVQVLLTPDANIPEALCARDPIVQGDGSLKGSVVTRSDELNLLDGTFGFPEVDAFPDAGSWACVARAIGGPDDLHTGWSAPVRVRVPGELHVLASTLLDRSYPTYVVRFPIDRGAAGGTLTFRLRSCGRYSKGPSGRRLKPARLTLRARVDRRGNATFRFKRRVPFTQFGRYFVGRGAFSGTSLIPRSTTRNTFAFYEYNDLFEGPLLGVSSPAGC